MPYIIFLSAFLFFSTTFAMISTGGEAEYKSYERFKSQIAQSKKPQDKKNLSKEALKQLLLAAQLRYPQAMEYFQTMEEIKLLIYAVDIQQRKSKEMSPWLKRLLTGLIDQGNSFAALVAINFFGQSQHNKLLDEDQNPIHLMQQALSCEQKNDLSGALSWLEDSLSQGYLPAHRRKAWILLEQEKPKEAIEIYRVLIAKYGDSFSENLLGTLLIAYSEYRQNPNEHQELLLKANERGDFGAKISLADQHMRLGDFSRAENIIVELENMVRSSPLKVEERSGGHNSVDEWHAQLKTVTMLRSRFDNLVKAAELNPDSVNKFPPFSTLCSIGQGEQLLEELIDHNKRFAMFLKELEELQCQMDAEEIAKKKKSKPQSKYQKNAIPTWRNKTEIAEKNDDIDSSEQKTCVVDKSSADKLNDDKNSYEEDLKAKADIEVSPSFDGTTPLLCETKENPDEYVNYQHQFTKKNKRPTEEEPKSQDIEDQEFRTHVAELLDKVKYIILKLFSHENVSEKEVRAVLNKIGVKKPDYVRGAHNNTKISFDDKHTARTILIKPHRNSNPRTNKGQLRKIFDDFKLTPDNLWPK